MPGYQVSSLYSKVQTGSLPEVEQRLWPFEMQTITEINAPRDKIWELLNDFESYKDWNPLLPKFSVKNGEFQVGKRFRVHVQTSTSRKTCFWAYITLADEYHYRWIGQARNVFESEHYFRLETIDEKRTRLVHGTIFSGFLPRLRKGYINSYTKTSYETMNNILKERAEGKFNEPSNKEEEINAAKLVIAEDAVVSVQPEIEAVA